MVEVILVDYDDNPIGTMEKLAAHQDGGHLHRAISVLLFDHQGRMMLQQRADGKYHCPWLWANTCCSHPHPGESSHDAAHRRLREEMGMVVDLAEVFHFTYQAPFDNGLVEHELDHVFAGVTDTTPSLNRDEVQDRKRMTRDELDRDISENSQRYAPWFLIMVREHRQYFLDRIRGRGILM